VEFKEGDRATYVFRNGMPDMPVPVIVDKVRDDEILVHLSWANDVRFTVRANELIEPVVEHNHNSKGTYSMCPACGTEWMVVK
jgi:hypothetical protein